MYEPTLPFTRVGFTIRVNEKINEANDYLPILIFLALLSRKDFLELATRRTSQGVVIALTELLLILS